MASSSNPLPETSMAIHEQRYLHASNANFSNFVTVKLSNIDDYRVWKTQMLCLMETHDMCGIVDESFDCPKASYDIKIMKKYDSLLKGWIFGSISRALLDNVVDLSSAKDVWEKLDSIYNPSFQRDSAVANTEAKQETKDENVVEVEIEISKGTENEEHKKRLRDATSNENWAELRDILVEHKDAVREEIDNDGDTVLHLAVYWRHNDIVRRFVDFIEDDIEVLEAKNKKGETALHYAVHYDNKVAAQLLVERNVSLLTIVDNEGHDPWDKAYSRRDMDMLMCLYGANKNFAETEANGKRRTREVIQYVVDTIFDNQFSRASEMVTKFPELAVESDDVLMALASTFPRGLTKGEEFFYPSSLDLTGILQLSCEPPLLFDIFYTWFFGYLESAGRIVGTIMSLSMLLLGLPLLMLQIVYYLIRPLILMAFVLFYWLYSLSWKVAAWSGMVPFTKHIMEERNKWEKAYDLLKLVCDEIDESGTLANYDRPILKAASHQNAYPVVKKIFFRKREYALSKDKNGLDIIQLGVIHRSENLYNLIHSLGERKLVYGTLQDGSGNNILHLVARLPPSHELKPKRGAALQLQREIQWFEEVKKLLVPSYIFKENIFKETPDMVFTREHANLVKEAEAWMKTTAESCSIIAALITTVVFAAAITVPGGSNQETGTPLLIKDTAFNIFGISNAISLFMSSTSLLVFLSILTARFAEEDFLVRLPRRLIIGLCTLLLSVTSMMVAFSATLFIVFYHEKPWMLGPICGLASLPITFFVSVQFPLLVDLFGTTYGDNFGEY